MLPSWPGEPPKISTRHTHNYISIYINIIMMNCTTESSNIFQYKWILSWLVPQGLTKPRQMLVVKDTCMAAIEYFTEPGDHLSILIILIDIVIVIEYLTGPGDQLLVIAQINRPPTTNQYCCCYCYCWHKKTTQASSANKKTGKYKKKHPGITEDEWLSEKQQVSLLKTFQLENFKHTLIRKYPLPTMKI